MSELSKQCPRCRNQLVFSPDGRRLGCERCDYTTVVQRDRGSPAEIAAVQVFTMSGAEDTSRFRPHVRDVLRLGISAAKNGDKDEAHFYLESVLCKDSNAGEQAQAWLWLGEVYDNPTDKEECLRQALAIDPNNPLARRAKALLDGRLHRDEIIDPEALVRQADNEATEVGAEHFRCPQCSAPLVFAPDGESLRCEFCEYGRRIRDGNEAPTPKGAAGIGSMEQDFVAAMATARGHLHPVSARILRCQGCAVEFALGPESLSITCPYCGAVYVTEVAESRQIMPPHALIPFAIDQEGARRALRQWFDKHQLSPLQTSPILGIYLPVWTFDVSGNIRWRGQERNGDQWSPVSGDYYLLQDDFCVPASQSAFSNSTGVLEDFELETLVAYDPSYLVDWPAERHRLALADASLVARKQILEALQRRPDKLADGRDVRSIRLNSRGMTILSFKLILLPIWLTHYWMEQKAYHVIINGQTGKVTGDQPGGVVKRLLSWLRGS